MPEWTHDALAADLMDSRHRAGEIAIERLRLGESAQLDVASLQISWDATITGYEIKVSRADLLSDIRSGKWRKYLERVQRLYFAMPAGLADPREIPIECGVMFRNHRGWYSRRKPQRQTIRTTARAAFVTALLFRHYPATWDGAARAARNVQDQLRVQQPGG